MVLYQLKRGKIMNTDIKLTGTIKFYNNTGWGFIVPDNKTRDIFFHISKVLCQPDELSEGVKCSYELFKSEGFKPAACNVEVI